MAHKCKCSPVGLSRLLDSQLAEAEKLDLERHVRTCATCTRTLNEFRAVNDVLVTPAPIEPDPYFWPKLRRRLTAEPKAVPRAILARLRPVLIPVAGAALVAVVVFTGSMLSRTITTGTQQAAVQAINGPSVGSQPTVSESIPVCPEDTLDEE